MKHGNGTSRIRGPAEVAFGAIRLLFADRLFWGVRAGLTLNSLGEVIGVTPGEVADALSVLHGEGLVRIDVADGCVGLTELGARELSPRHAATHVF